ncbi:MAG TPA: glycosyltransferase family 39 protein [Vicinamibacteria bacterium]
MSGQRGELMVVAAALLATLPFVSKAFHIDDAAYIERAEGGTALDARDLSVFAAQGRTPDPFEAMSHPPLVPSLIALDARLAGGVRELPQHLLFVAFPVVAAVSLFRLAGHWMPDPVWPTLLIVTSPVFVLSGQSVMTDMPMLALSLLSLAALAEGVRRGRWSWVVLSGVAAGLAMLTRYVALGLLPLLFVLELTQRRRAGAAAVAAAVAAAIAGTWALHEWAGHGTLHLLAAARHYFRYYAEDAFTLHATALKALSDTAALGGAMLAPALASVGDRPRAALASFAGGAAVAFAGPLPELQYYTLVQRAALAAFLGLGLFALVLAMAPRRVFLLIWLAGALVTAMVLLPFGASRYMLPAIAPLALLAFGDMRNGSGRWAAAVATNIALSLGLSVVDWSHAEAYRAFARSFHPAGRVWFVGEWGFRHYMRQAGHAYLRPDDRSPAPGDWIVRAELAGLHEVDADVRRRAPVTAVSDADCALPLRLMGFAAKAGFYSHAWGLLPYSVSRASLERFEIRRVQAGGGP